MSSSFKLSSDEASSSVMSSSDEASASVRSSSITLSSDEAKDSMRSSLLQSSEEVQEVFCDPCTIGEGIEKEALFFCQECKEFLCNECREFHRKNSTTKKHNVSQIDEPKTASSLRSKVNNIWKQISSLTVRKATRKTPSGQTVDSVKPFTTATLTNQFNASLDDDNKPCNIFGVLIVGNLIYMADYDNGKIKLFNMKGQAISQYSEPCAYDIASIGKDRIACTSVGLYFTIIDTTRNTLKKVKTVTTNANTRGICCYNRQIYVSCFNQNNPNILPQILIFTTEGKLTRKIEPMLDEKRILQEPNYISLNKHNGTIYVSDKVGVIALSFDGKVQFVEQVFDRTTNAQGIAIDDQGQVYVCGMYTDNVMTMSLDGSEVFEILKMFSTYIRANEIVGNQMCLGCAQSDIVHVFTLS